VLNQGQTNAPINYVGLNVGTSQWNMPIPIFWGRRRLSTNAIAFYDFTVEPVDGKGKGLGGKNEAHKYFANCILGLCVGSIDEVTNIWANGSTTTVSTLADVGMIVFYGTISQAPWSLIATKHPTLARAYSQTAYLGAPGLSLGESATIPDNGFETLRYAMFVDAGSFVLINPTGGWINPNTHQQSPSADCLMSDIITDFLTNVQYGLGFGAGDLGPISQYATYMQAQGLFYSPLLVSQEKATEIIDRWAQLSNSWIYWSGTQLQFVPLGDSAVTGNGVTYTPVQDVAADVAFDDLIYDASSSGDDESPIKITRKDPADAHNRTCLNFTDRTLGYIDNPVQWKEDPTIRVGGLRDDSTTQADEICDPGVAAIVVQLLGKRNAYLLNEYEFKVHSRTGILWLPGSILTLNEPNIGFSQFPVRVKTIDRDDKRVLTVTCEWFPGNVGSYYPPLNLVATAPSTTPITNIAPGNVNTPAIVEPNSAYTGGTPQVIIAASGGVNWGGCTVNISFDGTNYSQIGTISGAAKQGVLTAALAAYGGANPDTTDTLAVDCTESQTIPSPVTNADASSLRTLSLIAAQPTLSGGAYVVPTNGELLAFGALTATATYAANLSYLYRGAYGTTAGAHSIGDQFTLIDVSGTDGTSVAFDLPAEYIGQTLYLKLCSFNVFGQAQQDISTVLEYQYTPAGAGFGTGTNGVPAEPTGLTVVATGAGSVELGWSANPVTDNVTAYVLSRAAGTGASFGSAAVVWTGLALGDLDGMLAGSTGYTYFLQARNAVGLSPATAGVNATTSHAAGGTLTLPTNENLAAGALCNIWDDAGVATLRNADQTTTGKTADVFVVAATTSPASATAYPPGSIVTGLSGLTPGTLYFLGAAGAVTATPPTTTGYTVQQVGKALSATTLLFAPGVPNEL
jgi:hypothetical protein